MTSNKSPLATFIGFFLILGCLAMLVTFIWITMQQGKERAHNHAQVSTDSSGSSGSVEGNIVALMQKIQEDPEDTKALKELGILFLSTEDWNRAEYFLKQSLAFDPYNASTLSLLGMAQYRLQNYGAAAMSLEMSITHDKTPEALFNLATINAYKLDNKERGIELLKELLSLENIPEQLQQIAKTELQKLEAGQENSGK